MAGEGKIADIFYNVTSLTWTDPVSGWMVSMDLTTPASSCPETKEEGERSRQRSLFLDHEIAFSAFTWSHISTMIVARNFLYLGDLCFNLV